MKFEIIHATCKGIKHKSLPNQDFTMINENNQHLIATVSDGLGSSIHALDGAKLACNVVVDYFKRSIQNIEPVALKTGIPKEWNRIIIEKPGERKEYRTANSFLVVLKKERKIIIGCLGDVKIAIRIDGVFIPIALFEKDFINETECLGSEGKQEYEILFHDFKNTFEFLIASDGIGDELEIEKASLLFNYLKGKYGSVKRKERNNLLKKEIHQTLSDKNNDDKSLVFGWSNE